MNEHVNPVMAEVLNAFAPTAMAERYKAATIDKSSHACDQLYRSLTMLKIYYDYGSLVRNGYEPAQLCANADAVQEFLITVSVFAERLDEDNAIRLAWERCISKTVDVGDNVEDVS
jgi:hypothetical protein